jgi:L-alanine-DL-glutamate epimerase-like enolase superfamily enzyme
VTAAADRVDAVEATAFTVPTDAPEADGTLSWTSTTLVIVQVTAGELVGTGYTYAPAAAAGFVRDVLAGTVVGAVVDDVPASVLAATVALRNAGRPGVAGCALSALDIALWDLKARALGVPIEALLGRVRTHVRIYGSGGFTTYHERQLADQVADWLGVGATAVKIKIAESNGTRVDRDLARIVAVRTLVGDDVEVFADANGGYTRKQAVRVGRDLEAAGVTWFEEPVSSDDLAGLRLVRDRLDLDVAAGEYGFDLADFRRMCEAGSVDCLQVDATRCGGVSEWLRVTALAAAYGLDVSAHCAPQLHRPLAAATPNARHVEWFHDHVRIERLAFDGVVAPSHGQLSATDDVAGLGLTPKWADLETYRVA